MLEESNQIERERIALSDQGLFRSTASIEIHWRAIRLNERLIVTAMRAGREKLADLTRVELKRMQNELLRATGWPVEKPQPAPEPARAPQPTTPNQPRVPMTRAIDAFLATGRLFAVDRGGYIPESSVGPPWDHQFLLKPPDSLRLHSAALAAPGSLSREPFGGLRTP